MERLIIELDTDRNNELLARIKNFPGIDAEMTKTQLEDMIKDLAAVHEKMCEIDGV